MFARISVALLLCSVVCHPQINSAPQETSQYTWDLQSLYPTNQSWDDEAQYIRDRAAQIKSLRGKLGASPKALADGLDQISELRARVMKMNVYVNLFTDSDSTSKLATSRYDLATSLQAQVESSIAFVPEEVLAIGEKHLLACRTQEPTLDRHWIRIQRILREGKHTLPTNEQAIVASMARWPLLAADTYWAVQESSLGWPTLTDASGKATPVNLSTYRTKFHGEATSIKATQLLLRKMGQYEELFALLYTRRIDADLTIARHRNFSDGIEALWFLRDGMPPGSQKVMIDVARSNIPLLRRYLRIRSRALGLTTNKYSNLFAQPSDVNQKFTLEQAISIAIDASAPLGRDYQERLRSRLTAHWADLLPRAGKRDLMSLYPGVAGSHPYFLLSFNSDYSSARNLCGGLTDMMKEGDIKQGYGPDTIDDPPAYGNGVLYVGNMLFDDYMLKHANSRAQRVTAVVSALDLLWARYFRWVLVAELDAKVQQLLIDGKTPSGADISQIYLRLLQDYYGTDGVDTDASKEWMLFPVPFLSYEHQLWVPAIAAASAIKEGLDKNDPQALRAVNKLYGTTDSDRSFYLLKEVGIDLSKPAPYEAAMKRMDMKLTELEQLLH